MGSRISALGWSRIGTKRMVLTKEVLPPRPAPLAPSDFVSEAQVRATITRAIWTSVMLVGLANVLAHMLGTCL